MAFDDTNKELLLYNTHLNVNFKESPTRANVKSGENISTSLGKIQKYLNDLGDAAFLDTDTAPTQNSTNPITSGAVYTALASKQDELTQAQLAAANSGITAAKLTADEAAIVEVVDNGAKNRFDPASTWDSKTAYGVTVTRNGDTYSIASGTTQSGDNNFINMGYQANTNLIPAGDWVLSFDTPQQNVRLQVCWNGTLHANSSFGNNCFFTVPENTTDSWFRIILRGSTNMAGTSFKIMLCPRILWDVSHQFEPYALSNPVITPALIEQVDIGAKNCATVNNATYTNVPRYIVIDSICDKNCVLSLDSITSTDTNASTCALLFKFEDDTLSSTIIQLPRGTRYEGEFSFDKNVKSLQIYASDNYNHSGTTNTVTITNLMLCTKTAWDISHKFVPYRLPYQQISDAVLNKTPVVYGFHVNPNESDPSAAVTYLLDAVGMTPAKMGSSTFSYGSWKNAFFMPKPCMLKYDGTVDYYLNPDDYTKKSDGTASDVANASYDGNAMMEWPKIWFKYVPGGVDGEWEFYVSNQNVDGTYRCWCNINAAGQEIDHFYTAIYNGTGTTKLRSISGVQLTTANGADNTTRQEEIDRALANNTGTDVMWYTEVWSDRLLINALLYLIGKSLDLQSTFGQGMTSGSQTAKHNYYTGGKLDSNSTFNLNNKGLFWGDITNTTNPVKVFGMENIWGCVYRSCAGLVAVDNELKVKLTYDVQDGSTAHGYNFTGNGYLSFGTSASSGYITKMKADSDKGYIPSSAGETGAGASAYYCDYYYISQSGTRYVLLGGDSGSGTICGFSVRLGNAVSDAYWLVSAALSCKPQS